MLKAADLGSFLPVLVGGPKLAVTKRLMKNPAAVLLAMSVFLFGF
jgi:hypothetical protein